MSVILAARHPFEVTGLVVQLVTVLVVHLMARGTRTKKGFGY